MPTAAKLTGAILFAALAWLVSMRLSATMPALGTVFAAINTVLGALMGWRVMGTRAGDGFVPAIGYGLTTVFSITFWAILIWSGYTMLNGSVRGRYSGPVDALQGFADIMVEFASLLVVPGVVGTAVIGGVICALVTEFASHRWS